MHTLQHTKTHLYTANTLLRLQTHVPTQQPHTSPTTTHTRTLNTVWSAWPLTASALVSLVMQNVTKHVHATLVCASIGQWGHVQHVYWVWMCGKLIRGVWIAIHVEIFTMVWGGGGGSVHDRWDTVSPCFSFTMMHNHTHPSTHTSLHPNPCYPPKHTHTYTHTHTQRYWRVVHLAAMWRPSTNISMHPHKTPPTPMHQTHHTASVLYHHLHMDLKHEVCVRVYVCLRVYVRVFVGVCVCVRVYTVIYQHNEVPVCVCMHCTPSHAHPPTCPHRHIYTPTHIHPNMYTHTHIYTPTHSNR